MGKIEFLDTLKRAMSGLPPELQSKTLGYYEQRFVDGVAEGLSEEEIAKQFDDPRKIAMTLRANTHMQAFQTRKNPASFLRLLFAAIGLAIFNLFMVVPAMVYAALLAALYASGLTFYLAGCVITASGLSGANEIKLDGPFSHIFVEDNDYGMPGEVQTKVSISEDGVRIYSEPSKDDADSGKTGADATERSGRDAARSGRDAARAAALAAARARVEATAAAATAVEASKGATEAAAEAADAAAEAAEAQAALAELEEEANSDGKSVRVIKRAESVASQGIVVETDSDENSRATQTAMGLAMVLGGILLLLLSLVITRYTFIGIKRYVDMNISLLKGH